MKRTLYAILGFLCFNFSTTYAQTWAKSLGSTSIDQAKSMTVDVGGNSYVAGFFSGTIPLGNSTVISSGGQRDIFLARYGSDGTLLWAKGIGGPGDDEAKDVAVDLSGNIYIIGEFVGLVDFDPSVGIAIKSSVAASDVFIAKFDAAGNFVWVESIEGQGADLGYSIEVGANSDIYVSGFFNGNLNFSTSLTTDDLTLTENSAIFLAKYTSAGSFVWSKKIESSENIVVKDMTIDGADNFYCTGTYKANTDFDPDPNTVKTLSLSGNTDAFLAKYSNTGALLWARSIHGINIEESETVEIAPDGNILIGGHFLNSIDLDPSNSNNFITSIGQRDAFIANYTPAGGFRWGKSFGGTGNEYGYSLDTDNQGRIFMTGTFQGTIDINPDPNVAANLTSSAGSDIYIVKLDSIGNYLWGTSAGGSNGDLAESIAVNTNEEVYLSGWFQGSALLGNTTLNSAGDRDIFIAKISLATISNTYQFDNKIDVKVSPNPFHSFIKIEGIEGLKSTQVILTDMLGKTIFLTNIRSNSTISLPTHLTNGLYILQLYQEGNLVTTKKLMK